MLLMQVMMIYVMQLTLLLFLQCPAFQLERTMQSHVDFDCKTMAATAPRLD